jgi:small subunit ribosomal protein S7
MPRKGAVPRREIPGDPKYNNKLVSKFVNAIMLNGKRGLAERIVYGSFEVAAKRTNKDQIGLFQQALDNAMPLIEVRPRRVGGATYQVPVEIRTERRLSLGMRWLVKGARARAGRSMMEKLAAELADASQGIGSAVKKKEDTHRMAEANKAFAHYRW